MTRTYTSLLASLPPPFELLKRMKLADAALQRTFTRAQYRLTHLQTALQRLDTFPVGVPVGLGHVRARLSQLESMYDRQTVNFRQRNYDR